MSDWTISMIAQSKRTATRFNIKAQGRAAHLGYLSPPARRVAEQHRACEQGQPGGRNSHCRWRKPPDALPDEEQPGGRHNFYRRTMCRSGLRWLTPPARNLSASHLKPGFAHSQPKLTLPFSNRMRVRFFETPHFHARVPHGTLLAHPRLHWHRPCST